MNDAPFFAHRSTRNQLILNNSLLQRIKKQMNLSDNADESASAITASRQETSVSVDDNLQQSNKNVKGKNDTSKSLSMPGDTSNTETTTGEPDFSEKENSDDYATYLENTVYEESELPDALKDSILAELNELEDGEERKDVKEYYPRISPWVKQADIDVKSELNYVAEQIVKEWKRENKVTGGRVLDEKSLNDAPFFAHRSIKKREIEALVDSGINRVIYAKKAVHKNKSFDKKLKNQSKMGTPATTSVAGVRNNAVIAPSTDSDNTNIYSVNTNVNKKSGADYSLDLSTDTENAETTTREPDFSEKENSDDYATYLENTVYEESELPDALKDSILAELNELEDGEERKDVKEYYPRISPWVKQADIDVKSELNYVAEQIVKEWKRENKVTGGRVLDEKSVQKKVNELIQLSIGQFKLSNNSPKVDKAELKACSEVAMNALQNAWYEMNKQNPDRDVVSEILLETAEYLIPADSIYNYGETGKERNDTIRQFFKSINRKNPLIVSRWVWEDKRKKRSFNYTDEKKGWGGPDFNSSLSHPPGNRWETMRLLQHDASGLFSVRYAQTGEKPNWSVTLEDLYNELGYDAWNGATAEEYWDIRSEEDAIEFLVDLADSVLKQDTNFYEKLTEEEVNGERKELCCDLLTILNTDAESWNSIADSWKAKYDNLANRLQAERKAKSEAVKAERAKAKLNDAPFLPIVQRTARRRFLNVCLNMF